MRVVLAVQFRGFQVALADDLDLLLKELRIFLGGIEPVLTAVRLQFGLGQITIDLAGRNGGDDAALCEFVGEFSPCPLVNGPSRLVWRFTGNREDLRDLFGGELTRRPTPRRVTQDILNGAAKSLEYSAVSTMRRPRLPGCGVCRVCWCACFPLGAPRRKSLYGRS